MKCTQISRGEKRRPEMLLLSAMPQAPWGRAMAASVVVVMWLGFGAE